MKNIEKIVHLALDNAKSNGYEMHKMHPQAIVDELRSYDADLEHKHESHILPHVKSWLKKQGVTKQFTSITPSSVLAAQPDSLVAQSRMFASMQPTPKTTTVNFPPHPDYPGLHGSATKQDVSGPSIASRPDEHHNHEHMLSGHRERIEIAHEGGEIDTKEMYEHMRNLHKAHQAIHAIAVQHDNPQMIKFHRNEMNSIKDYMRKHQK